MSKRAKIALVTVGLLVGAYLYLQERKPVPLTEFEISGPTMGTTYRIIVAGPEERHIGDLGSSIQQMLDGIESRFSTWNENSELSQLNQAPTEEWVSVSPDLCNVLGNATEVARLSEGAFDPTVGHLVGLWGFTSNEDPVLLPNPSAVDAALANTGYQYLHTDCVNHRVRKDRNLSLDLSGFVKGYAVDQVAQHLIKVNAHSFLVEVGGEVFAYRGNRQRSWRIGIAAPGLSDNDPVDVIPVNSQGVATSGNYMNFFEIDGERYTHIIDPTTGYPVQHDTASVTVVAETAAEADAWATALLVLGSEKGLTAAQQRGIAAMFVDLREDDVVIRRSRVFDRIRMD